MKCHNENRALEWKSAINDMLGKGSGKYFAQAQRHGSYAPIRDKSTAKWFVDGADYMESIADAIEAAKEEIFIAGFFLTPEIYLKRPVITGDKYRLDSMLKRKAVSLPLSLICAQRKISEQSNSSRRKE
jgi:phospholipase D1/2